MNENYLAFMELVLNLSSFLLPVFLILSMVLCVLHVFLKLYFTFFDRSDSTEPKKASTGFLDKKGGEADEK